MRDNTVCIGLLTITAILGLMAGCININLPGGTTEPAQSTTEATDPATTPAPTPIPTPTPAPTPTPTSTPTPTATAPLIPTKPIIPTLIPHIPVIQPAIEGTSWRLEAMGKSGELESALDEKEVTLNFNDDDTLNGHGGCNEYFGTYTSDAFGSLKVADVSLTLMLCYPAVAEQEQAFLGALKKAEHYVVVGGKLEITAGDVVLVLIPA